MANNEFAPCQLIDNEDGTYSLLLTEFDATASVFEEMGQEAGGYGWHGAVEALVRMKAPGLARKVKYDPEASMFVAYGKDRAALEKVAGLIRAAIQDPALLREAIENADPELMD
jgi:hypothetical protein